MPFVPFTDEQMQDLEARFGAVDKVRGATPERKSWQKVDPEPPWECVFRKPLLGESDKFEGDSNNERAKAQALRSLARQIVVGVTFGGKLTMHIGGNEREVREAFDALRKVYPAAHIACKDAILALLGTEAEESGKE